MHELVEFLVQVQDLHREEPAAFDESACEAGDSAGDTIETAKEGAQMLGPPEASRRWLPRRVQLVQMPAKSVYGACSLCYQIISVIGQQPNLPGWSVQGGHR